jgi:hypothetical protein
LIEENTLPYLERVHQVISTKLLSARTIVHIYSQQDPGNGFVLVEPDLEDVYFSTIAGYHGTSQKKEVVS